MTKTLNFNYSALNLSSRHCAAWYEFRHGNESVISWVEFSSSKCTTRAWDEVHLSDVRVCVCFFSAVKVQKSNHHHWDQSSNYCHPPHGNHSKTWSSPSHPHNQQDHCKCKLSLVTAPLLARLQSRRLFFCTFVKSFPRGFLQHCCHVSSFCRVFPWALWSCRLLLWQTWINCHAWCVFALTVPAFWYV